MSQMDSNVGDSGNDPLERNSSMSSLKNWSKASSKGSETVPWVFREHLHCACLDHDAVPVNLTVRKLWPPFERPCSLQGFLGGSSIPSSSLPVQHYTPARVAAQKQIHRGDLKTEGTPDTPSHTCLSLSHQPSRTTVTTGWKTTERLLWGAHPGQAMTIPSTSKSLHTRQRDAYWWTLKEIRKYHWLTSS